MLTTTTTAAIFFTTIAPQKTVLQTPLRAWRSGQHPHDDGREPRGLRARDGWDEGGRGEVGRELGRCVCFCVSRYAVLRYVPDYSSGKMCSKRIALSAVLLRRKDIPSGRKRSWERCHFPVPLVSFCGVANMGKEEKATFSQPSFFRHETLLFVSPNRSLKFSKSASSISFPIVPPHRSSG